MIVAQSARNESRHHHDYRRTGDYVGALFADTSGSDTTLRSVGP